MSTSSRSTAATAWANGSSQPCWSIRSYRGCAAGCSARLTRTSSTAASDSASCATCSASWRGNPRTADRQPAPRARRSLRKSPSVPTPPVVSLKPMSQATLEGHRLLASGKVREIYEAGDDRLLLVASDRISTYDVVHPTPIPNKGEVLTGLSVFWFERTQDIVPNHLISYTDVPDEVKGRALLVEKLEMFPVECVVRGYITGSGWKDYQRTGAVCGIDLPAGLRESEQLPEPIFTPATKADVGDHDENIDFDKAAEILGDRAALEELRRVSIELYRFASEHARRNGIILADTKFEFGRDHESGRIVVGDEVLTPDSSRFWPADGYAPGTSQP